MLNDDLRYAEKDKRRLRPRRTTTTRQSDELAFVKIRYKKPDEDKSNLITMPVKAVEKKANSMPRADVRFSVAVPPSPRSSRGGAQVRTMAGMRSTLGLAPRARTATAIARNS